MRTPFVLLLAGCWGAAVGLLEARALESWYGIELHRWVHYAEAALNYGLMAFLDALILLAGVRVFRRFRPLDWPEEAHRQNRFVELGVGLAFAGIVGAAFFLNYPAGGRIASGILRWGLLAGVGGAFLVGAWILSAHLRVVGVLRLAMVALVLAVLLGPGAVHRAKSFAGSPAAGNPNQPDVLFVVLDTLRPDYLSCYGYPRPTSPRLDALAETGVRFQHCTAQASWTLPSTASILTGLYPSSHGAVTYGAGIADAPVRLAEVARDVGYRTAAFTENWYITPRNGFGRGFDTFWGYWFPWISDQLLVYRIAGDRLGIPLVNLFPKQEFPDELTDPSQLNWDARVTVDRALAWMADSTDPSFLYLHLMGPHGPYGPPEYLLPGDPPLVRISDHPREMGGTIPLGDPGKAIPPDELKVMQDLYAADIRYVDHHLGRLFDALDAAGRLENTLVVVTSDHGEEFFEHGGWNHGASAYDEVIRVPLIASWPRGFPGGRVSDYPAQSIDLFPTFSDLIGGKTPPNLPGQSLRDVLEGKPAIAHPAFVEACALRPEGAAIHALIDGSEKLISLRVDDREQQLLFDLSRDPAELADLAGVSTARAESLTVVIRAWESLQEQHRAAGTEVRLDEATRKLLESLGYVD